MTTFVIILLSLAVVGLVVALQTAVRRYRGALEQVRAHEEMIVAEERRMFSFLHDLGVSISRSDNHLAMYRLIVEGAQKVTDSTGGALYLIDAEGQSLVPRHFTDECAPLVDLPERIIVRAKENGDSLLSYMRLHAIGVNEGLLGNMLAQERCEILPDLWKHPKLTSAPNSFQANRTVMLGPLRFGDRRLGVLAVSAPKGDRVFSENDLEVFQSLVEQSAFALHNAMAHQEASEKRNMDAELRSASEIQHILLPEADPEVPGFVVAGRNIAARVLSGDFYDYVSLGDDRWGACIADVSGKGTPAALISAMTRSVLHCHAGKAMSPADALAAVNRQLCPDIREDMFVSMTYLVLEPNSSEITFARAGHTLPLLWSKETGTVRELKSGGLAVGIDKGEVFERVTKDVTFTMQPGDCLLLYTDGVNEALDAKGLEFGEKRIYKTLSTKAKDGPTAVIDQIVQDVDKFLGGRRSHDDITLIAIQKTA